MALPNALLIDILAELPESRWQQAEEACLREAECREAGAIANLGGEVRAGSGSRCRTGMLEGGGRDIAMEGRYGAGEGRRCPDDGAGSRTRPGQSRDGRDRRDGVESREPGLWKAEGVRMMEPGAERGRDGVRTNGTAGTKSKAESQGRGRPEASECWSQEPKAEMESGKAGAARTKLWKARTRSGQSRGAGMVGSRDEVGAKPRGRDGRESLVQGWWSRAEGGDGQS